MAMVVVAGAPALGSEDRGSDVTSLQRAWSELLDDRGDLLRAVAETEAMRSAAERRAADATRDLAWIHRETEAARGRLAVATADRDRASVEREDARERLRRSARRLQRSRDTLGAHAATIYKHGIPALGAIEGLLRSGSPGDYLVHHRLGQAVLVEDDAEVTRSTAARDAAADAYRIAVRHAAATQARVREASQDLDALVDLAAEQERHLVSARRAEDVRLREAVRAASAAAENSEALVRLEARLATVDHDRSAALVERRVATEEEVRVEVAEDYPFLGGPAPHRPPSMPPILGYECPVAGGTFTNDWAFSRPGGRSHEGTDVFAARGTTATAVVTGNVVEVDRHDGHEPGALSGDLGGRSVTIQSVEGERWYYAHLDEVADGLQVGDGVVAGQAIGTVGDTGNAEGGAPHLHLGRTWEGAPVNPHPTLFAACSSDGSVPPARPVHTPLP